MNAAAAVLGHLLVGTRLPFMQRAFVVGRIRVQFPGAADAHYYIVSSRHSAAHFTRFTPALVYDVQLLYFTLST